MSAPFYFPVCFENYATTEHSAMYVSYELQKKKYNVSKKLKSCERINLSNVIKLIA